MVATYSFSDKIGDKAITYSPVNEFPDAPDAAFDDALAGLSSFVFICGFPKTATTTLASILDSHHDITAPAIKEPFFFSTDEYRFGRGYYWAKYFANYRGQRHVFDGNTALSFQPYAARRIAETIPNAKIVLSIRHPIERAHSNWWMYRTSREEDLSFAEAVDWELDELERGLLPVGDEDTDFWHWYMRRLVTRDHEVRRRTVRTYLSRGHYDTHVGRFLHYFKRENVLIVRQDEVRRNRLNTIQRLLAFVGADTSDLKPQDNDYHVNRNSLLITDMLARFDPLISALPPQVRRFGGSVVSGVDRRLNKTTVEPALRQRLVEHYRPHNETLGALLGEDFSHWNH